VAWQIHYLKDDRPYQASALALADALAIACQFLRDGHVIEKIQADIGMTISAYEVRPLCGEQQLPRHAA
jgi:hypothetical protein